MPIMNTPFNRFPIGTPQGSWVVLLLSMLYGSLIILRILFDIVRGKFFSLPKTKLNRPRPSILDSNKLGKHKFIQLKNVKLHYVSVGNENLPLMLFLHGFPECWYSWKYQLEHFSKDYHAVAVNLRGYGESDKPSDIDDYTTDKLVGDIVELIQVLSPKSKCILVAHDWGGAIAWLLVTYKPELIEKFIVLNAPNPKIFWNRLKHDWKQFFASWYMFFFQLPCLPEYRFKNGDFIFLDYCFQKYFKSSEDIEVYKYYFSNGPNAITGPLNYYRASLKRIATKKEKVKQDNLISVPTLIIWGTGDMALVTDIANDSFKVCSNAKVELIEDCSHWIQLERPNEVNGFIRKFVTNSK